MLIRTSIVLATIMISSFGAGNSQAEPDRIITGSGETPPAFVQVGPQQFERYEVATASSDDRTGGTDGVITGAEKPLVSLVRTGEDVQRFIDSLYPGADGYRPDGRVDP